MTLLRFLLYLFTFIGALAAAGALVISVLLMLRFPPLLVAVLLACWILNRLIRILMTPTVSRAQSTVRQA
jgi:ABC-type bacteriocin/lantibiotic exporter with double-glycine peptidase domain